MAPEAPTRSGWQKGPLLHHSSPPQTSLGILFVSLSCCGAPRFLQGQLRNVPSAHKHTQGVSLPLLVSYYCNSWCKRMSCSCVKAAQNVNTRGVWRLGAAALVRTLLLIENKTQWPSAWIAFPVRYSSSDFFISSPRDFPNTKRNLSLSRRQIACSLFITYSWKFSSQILRNNESRRCARRSSKSGLAN